MSSPNPQIPRHSAASGRACDLLTGAFLFLATAAFVLWQNAHLTVLWDLSYILENATRIALGQIPYRDFPFPYAPRHLSRAGRHHQALRTRRSPPLSLRRRHRRRSPRCSPGASCSACSPPRALPARLIAFLLAAPLIFLGTSSIFPHPFYDSDCTLFILLLHLAALASGIRKFSRRFPPSPAESCSSVPLFIKQNTGLAFLLSAVVCIAFLGIRRHRFRVPLLCSWPEPPPDAPWPSRSSIAPPASPTISTGRFSSRPRAVFPASPPCSASIATPHCSGSISSSLSASRFSCSAPCSRRTRLRAPVSAPSAGSPRHFSLCHFSGPSPRSFCSRMPPTASKLSSISGPCC